MAQHLNLLHAGLRPRREPAKHGQGLLIVGLTALALVAAGLTLQTLVQRREAELVQLNQALDQQRQRLLADTAAARLPGDAQAELERLRQAEATEQRLRQAIAGGQAGRADGHSALLLALARQADPAVWLTAVKVGADGEALELEGRMADPAALPDYLRRLQTEPLFHGRRFAQLQLQRLDAGNDANPETTALTRFVLRSQASGAATSAATGTPNPSTGARP